MVNESRTDIYEYLYNLFYGTVTENVYSMSEPQELTDSDKEDGFLVIHVGEMYDASEFPKHTYGEVRCFVEAFLPPMSRGRLDVDKLREFEDGIENVISQAVQSDNIGDYSIEEDSILSMDAFKNTNADNTFYTFIKSFIIVIDKEQD